MSRVFRVQHRAPRASQIGKVRGQPVQTADPADVLAEAKRSASQLLESARSEVAALLESAKTESAVLREQASEEGYREGRERGFEEGMQAASDLISEARGVLRQANEAFDSMLAESEPKLLALALSVARRVAAESIKADPEVALDLIRKGMGALRDEREFSLHVDPTLVSLLEGAKDDLEREFGAHRVEVVPDTGVDDGALVRTRHGFVDATVESQIMNVAKALAEARKRFVEVEQ